MQFFATSQSETLDVETAVSKHARIRRHQSFQIHFLLTSFRQLTVAIIPRWKRVLQWRLMLELLSSKVSVDQDLSVIVAAMMTSSRGLSQLFSRARDTAT